MTLRACPDVSPADWIVGSSLPWARLVTFGPSGFGAYARLRHLPDPAYQGQSENEAGVEGTWWEGRDQLATLLYVLGSHTTTPGDCYVCFWDGYADSDGEMPADLRELSRARGAMPSWYPDAAFPASMPQPSRFAQPASHPDVSPSQAPVVLPNRTYFLFHGSIADAYHWDDTELWTGQARLRPTRPAFVWPADRAWCVAGDVDPHWTGIGADSHVIDRLIDDPRLDVVDTDPRAEQPRYR